MPLASFSFLSILSGQRYPTNSQGFRYDLNVDDTPTYISNWCISLYLFFFVLHFLLLAGYPTSVPTAESSSDTNWVLSLASLQLFS